MLDLSASHWIQLIVGLSVAGFLMGLAYFTPRFSVAALLVLIPFQFITTRYGSLNVAVTYPIFFGLLLNGSITRLPLFLSSALVFFAALLSLTQVPLTYVFDHVDYMVIVGSNFLVLWMAYAFVQRSERPDSVFRLVLVMNILVIFYCYFQLLIGFERFAFLGISEFTLQQNRLAGQRLAGPFAAVGVTAEYLVLQTLILGYLILQTRTRSAKVALFCLVAANFAFLIATGNRGGVISLLLGGLLFGYLYRRELGFMKLFGGGMAVTLVFVLMSVVILTYTDFNLLYTRIAETKFEGGLPDTRVEIWPLIWKEIKEKPYLGHGPRFRMIEEEYGPLGLKFLPYPHSLYLFILYTLGVMGLVCYLLFFFTALLRIGRSMSLPCSDVFVKGIPKLGVIVLIVFLVDQAKVSFLRTNLSDYQHYVFMLLGLFAAFSDLVRERAAEKEMEPVRARGIMAGEPGLGP